MNQAPRATQKTRVPSRADDIWNGIALCPNHHQLFDGSAFVIEPELLVRVDDERVDYIKDNELDQGIEVLTNFADKAIQPPEFWGSNAAHRERMKSALEQRVIAAGLA